MTITVLTCSRASAYDHRWRHLRRPARRGGTVAVRAGCGGVVVRCGEEKQVSEQTRPVQVVRVVYICDSCGIGEMRASGGELTSYPPQYPHACTHCGSIKTFRGVAYPRIEYIDTPPDCDALGHPPTFEQRHDANVATLQELHDMVWGKE